MAHQLLQDDRSSSKLAYAYALNGDSAAAHAILDQFLHRAQQGHFKSVLVADVYLGLGDRNAALEWLSISLMKGIARPFSMNLPTMRFAMTRAISVSWPE